MPFTAGELVAVRGERWQVETATRFSDVTLLTLSQPDDAGTPRRCRLLVPFDRPAVVSSQRIVRAVSRRRWAHAWRARLSSSRVFGQLRAAQHANIALMPFQLEPVLALLRGRACRFLLADEVGLGKTIQTGLMLAELQHLGRCERALILVPPGLRHQWAEELSHRFGIRAAVLDSNGLAALSAALPPDVNPWSVEQTVITSIDFVKQPEVLAAACTITWDILVVDEAHQVTTLTQRRDAVARLAERARHVVLVTATPHAGDAADYRALCELGKYGHDDPIVLFRRTRESAGLPRSRRAHLLPVALPEPAREMHALVDAYVTSLWALAAKPGKTDLRLLAMVLAKRACSSPHALALSIERRIASLAAHDADVATQHPLPFLEDDPSDTAAISAVPALDSRDEELAALERLLTCARSAARTDPKLAALCRLLRRVHEPAIVFTEYRDTLDTIAAAVGGARTIAILHGGQTAQERRSSIATFTSGRADLLVATDAGSEGINLQPTCRLVISLELPWNPIKLEQRIGRVDRIGQSRTVHAINLFAAGTAESVVLANLNRRLGAIRMSEIEVAASVIGRCEPTAGSGATPAETITVDLHTDAEREAARLSIIRSQKPSPHPLPLSPFRAAIPVCVLGRSPAHAIAFLRYRLITHGGRLVEDALLPVQLAVPRLSRNLRRRDIRVIAERYIESTARALVQCTRRHADTHAHMLTAIASAAVERAAARERCIAAMTRTSASLIQPGLFDSRAIKDRRHAQARTADASPDDTAIIVAGDPEIVLLLFAW